MRFVRILLCLLLTSMINAFSEAEKQLYQAQLSPYRVYIVKSGSKIRLLIPQESVFQGETSYFEEGSEALTNILSDLIARSQGKVEMSGLMNETNFQDSLKASALYEQVSTLSKRLLAQSTSVSYAPVIVNSYKKNDRYGIWEIYPDTDTFIRLQLNVD